VKEASPRIFVVCSDLMFSARIREAGAAHGGVFEFISSAGKFEEAISNLQAELLLVDLHHPALGGPAAEGLIQKLRPDPRSKGAYAMAWGAHTETEMLKSAERAGFDKVMPRSAFVKEMPEVVRRAAGRIRSRREG
jgi:DNA-binding NarL/FixJ family response regulator